jgi:hypothetical protein
MVAPGFELGSARGSGAKGQLHISRGAAIEDFATVGSDFEAGLVDGAYIPIRIRGTATQDW